MATARKGPVRAAPAKKAAPAKTTRGRVQDRGLIAGKQGYEVTYEAKKDGKTAAEIKAAIEKVGHSRVKVRKLLSGGG